MFSPLEHIRQVSRIISGNLDLLEQQQLLQILKKLELLHQQQFLLNKDKNLDEMVG
ncbi:hypothetical protein [Adhaeribacter pallidiroseus]|uniref:Uncharacterized protein n=1 Tax=Adhaeribacter pallidiroseus TaxID=2072847 RepID=A0A369QGS5_9BACT|nr:hypothetical protein [Adhaeribacter pallidiroseus]RDC63622.1 hypothetical protein AHMF7616_02227 [Adhaeribacter pallidiroseus]